jgi:hypothetical protein
MSTNSEREGRSVAFKRLSSARVTSFVASASGFGDYRKPA